MNFETLIEFIRPNRKSCKDFSGDIGALVLDSRKVTQNSVFIAVKGTNADGHDYLNDAVQKGASILICESSYETNNTGVCVLEVEDTRKLIGPLAQLFEDNPASKLKVVGITGTNGKTTTTTLIYQVLSQLGAKVSLLGTISKIIDGQAYDAKLTTADPIELAADMRAMVEAGSEYLIMEVSSHALAQQRVNGINFTTAVFTNLSHDHLDYHSTMDKYAAAKKLLFDNLSSSATAIINADDAYGEFMVQDCTAEVRKLRFGSDDARVDSNSSSGLQITVQKQQINSPLSGLFNAYNIAEAYLVCTSLSYPGPQVAEALSTASGAAGRMESVEIDASIKLPKVIVDYSHTPGALDNALSTLKDLKTKNQRLIVVFGAGGDRDKTKRPEMAEVSERLADIVFVTSDNPRTENPEAIIDDIIKGFRSPEKVRRLSSREEAINDAIKSAGENDIILIAGKGHETYQEINGIRHPFDDRKIAAKALKFKAGGGY